MWYIGIGIEIFVIFIVLMGSVSVSVSDIANGANGFVLQVAFPDSFNNPHLDIDVNGGAIVGHTILQNNTGASSSSGFGHTALNSNTGGYTSGFGYAVLGSNTGTITKSPRFNKNIGDKVMKILRILCWIFIVLAFIYTLSSNIK